MKICETYGRQSRDSYDAYHCPRCGDTGEEPKHMDPTLPDRLEGSDG